MKSIQNNEKQLRAAFHPHLHKLSTAAWLLKLLLIPIGLWTASLLSALITSAVSADLSAVLVSGTTVISVLCMQKLFDILTGTAYQKALLLETPFDTFYSILLSTLSILDKQHNSISHLFYLLQLI